MIYYKRQGLLHFFEKLLSHVGKFENLHFWCLPFQEIGHQISFRGIVTPSTTRSLFDPVLNDCPLYGPLLSYDSEDEDSEGEGSEDEDAESDWVGLNQQSKSWLLQEAFDTWNTSTERIDWNCQNWLVASTACWNRLGKQWANGRLAAVNRGCFGGCHSWCYQNGEAPSIGWNQMYKIHVYCIIIYIHTLIHAYIYIYIYTHIILDHFRLGGYL